MRSLSEIETAVKRASRAVGFSWGNAEEIGKSIRQLELFGLKGIKNLNQYYKDKTIKKFEDLNLISETNETSLEAYCPIILGISFLDQIKSVESFKTIKFKKIAYPILLLSFFGALKFDPRSDKWLRICMFQGAPLPSELKNFDEQWVYKTTN